MRCLITGGAGFIGSHLARTLAPEHEIVVLDDLSTGKPSNLEGLDLELIEGSILDQSALERAISGVDVVFHLAAIASVQASIDNPDRSIDVNVKGLLRVLEAGRTAKIKKLVHASSAAVYGRSPSHPAAESARPLPQSPYATTKLDGEFHCDFYTQFYDLECVALRFFNVFGPHQDGKGAYATIIPIAIERALKNESITVYGDGEQTRDFIYVTDIVAACIKAATTSGMTGVFNVAQGEETSVNQIVEAVLRLSNTQSVVSYGPARIGEVRNSRANIDALRAYGWEPKTSVEDGLAETIKAALAN